MVIWFGAVVLMWMPFNVVGFCVMAVRGLHLNAFEACYSSRRKSFVQRTKKASTWSRVRPSRQRVDILISTNGSVVDFVICKVSRWWIR